MGLSTHINSLEETWYTFHVRAQTRQLEYNAKTRAHSNLYSYASPYIVHSSFVYSLYMPCWVSARRCPYPAHFRTKKVSFIWCMPPSMICDTTSLFGLCVQMSIARAPKECVWFMRNTRTQTQKKTTNKCRPNKRNQFRLSSNWRRAQVAPNYVHSARGTQFHSIKDGR